MHEAKTQFSKLAEAVEAGEEVIIARAGKPVMKLVKIEQVQEPIQQGFGAEWFTEWDETTLKALDKQFNSLFKDD